MEPTFWIIAGIVVWLFGIFFAWALVHGAEKLRRQHEAPMIAVPRPAGGYIEVVPSSAVAA